MEKAVVIEKMVMYRSVRIHLHHRIHAKSKCMTKKEENHRRVIYGFFERFPAASGCQGKRIPG